MIRYLILKHKKKKRNKIIHVSSCKKRNFCFKKTLPFNMINIIIFYFAFRFDFMHTWSRRFRGKFVQYVTSHFKIVPSNTEGSNYSILCES